MILRLISSRRQACVAVAAVISAFFGGNTSVLSSIADSATGFYVQMFFYRVLLQMLQPMLLMGIFCFWGIYLIIADYRWETVFRGLILIFIISLLPSLWAMTQYLDSALWQALYPDVDTLERAVKRQNQSYVERVLLDAASTVFNVIFPLILMYLVTEAGGGKPSSGIEASNRGADQIGRTSGQMASNTVSGTQRSTSKGMDRFHKWRAERGKDKNLPDGGSRY